MLSGNFWISFAARFKELIELKYVISALVYLSLLDNHFKRLTAKFPDTSIYPPWQNPLLCYVLLIIPLCYFLAPPQISKHHPNIRIRSLPELPYRYRHWILFLSISQISYAFSPPFQSSCSNRILCRPYNQRPAHISYGPRRTKTSSPYRLFNSLYAVLLSSRNIFIYTTPTTLNWFTDIRCSNHLDSLTLKTHLPPSSKYVKMTTSAYSIPAYITQHFKQTNVPSISLHIPAYMYTHQTNNPSENRSALHFHKLLCDILSLR